MATRAVELLVDLLKIFNPDDNEFKIFIGDRERETYIDYDVKGNNDNYEADDFNNIVDNISFDGIVPVQANDGNLFLKIGDFTYKTTDIVGLNRLYHGQSTGTVAGYVRYELGADKVWEYFALSNLDGLYEIELAHLGIGYMMVESTFIVG